MIKALIVAAALLSPMLSMRLPDETGPGEDAALRRAGALLWEMSEKHHEFSDRRIARGVTPERAQEMAESTAGALAKNRDGLAKLLPQLTADSRFAQDLSRFIQRWPDRGAFLSDLVADSNRQESGVQITSLAMQVKDTRRGWRTLFPFFRP